MIGILFEGDIPFTARSTKDLMRVTSTTEIKVKSNIYNQCLYGDISDRQTLTIIECKFEVTDDGFYSLKCGLFLLSV